jgi:hypothetical protein
MCVRTERCSRPTPHTVEKNGEFILGLLTQAPPVPVPDEPPASEAPAPMTVVTNLDDMRAAANRIAAGAQRLISIYTPDLESELYDQTEFLDIVKRFVLGRNFAKVRVVLGDASRMLRGNNRFVAMARRLTSYIDIRILRVKLPQRAEAYIIADDRAVLLRTDIESEEAIADFNNPPIARAHLAEFDAVWLANEPEPLFQPTNRRKA